MGRHFPYDLCPATPPGSSRTGVTPPGGIQAFMSRTPSGVLELGTRSALREPQNPLQARFARTDSVTLRLFVGLSVDATGHVGGALGMITANRRIRSRMARYSRRGMATSAMCSITVNRPVRTRMPGGVGAGGTKTPRLPD